MFVVQEEKEKVILLYKYYLEIKNIQFERTIKIKKNWSYGRQWKVFIVN